MDDTRLVDRQPNTRLGEICQGRGGMITCRNVVIEQRKNLTKELKNRKNYFYN